VNSVRRYKSADAGKTSSSSLPLRTLRPFGRFCILESRIEIRFGFSVLFVNHEMDEGLATSSYFHLHPILDPQRA
jgi:hypothetical protein